MDIVFIKRLMLPQDLSHCWLTDRQGTANPALDVSNVKDVVMEQLSFWTLSLRLKSHSGALSFVKVKSSRPSTSRYADETVINLSVTISGIVECSTPISLWSTFGRSFNYLLAIRREMFIRKSWRRTTVCCLNSKKCAYTLNGRNTQRLKGTFISKRQCKAVRHFESRSVFQANRRLFHKQVINEMKSHLFNIIFLIH